MSALNLAANRLNADTAGNTGGDNPDNAGGPAEPTAAADVRPMLEQIFSGGFHPEAVPALVDHGLERATDSIRGKLGGLRPGPGSVLQPGPAGSTAAAKAMAAGTFRRLVDAFKTPPNPEG